MGKEPTLAEKVRLYLVRAERDHLLMMPLEKVGLFKLVGGDYGDQGQFRKQMKPEFVRGRFVDAIACAVQQSPFYGEWCGHEDPSNCNNGRIELAELTRLERYKDILRELRKSR